MFQEQMKFLVVIYDELENILKLLQCAQQNNTESFTVKTFQQIPF